ncbi:MAG: hypothetical protein K2W96_15110 [Gemmataceae bacterium]|nr:hypothetical protein [Gemmataceae bacterium]
MLLLLFWAAPPLRDPLPEGAIARLGFARMRAAHGPVEASPDGKHVLAGWKRFRLTDGREVGGAPVGWELKRVFDDGSILCERGRELGVFDPAKPATPRAVIPLKDGERLAFDRAGRACVATVSLSGREEVRTTDLRRETRWVLQARVEGQARAWVCADGSRAGWATKAAWHVRDLDSGKSWSVARGGGRGSDRAFPSTDGKRLALVGGGVLRVLDIPSRKTLRTVEGAFDRPVPFSADGSLLVVMEHGRSRSLRAVPLDPAVEPWTVPGVDPEAFDLFPDGKRIAVLDRGGVLRVHDLRTGKPLDGHSRFTGPLGLRLVAKGRAAAWTGCGKLLLWDLRDGRVLSEASLPEGMVPQRFGADGALVAGFTKDAAVLAQTRTGKPLVRLAADPEKSAIGFHRSGTSLLVAAPAEKAVRVLHATPSRTRLVSECEAVGHRASTLAFSPDGRFLLLADEGGCTLCETATGKPRWSHGRAGASLHWRRSMPSVRFVPPSRVLVQAERCRSALFDLLTGERFAGPEPSAAPDDWLPPGIVVEPGRGTDPPSRVVEEAVDEAAGRRVTTHEDGTFLLWKVPASVPLPLDEWTLLAGDQPRDAMASLLKDQARALRLLGGKLVPVPHPPREAGRWIEELGADSFEVRTRAEAALEKRREACEGMMRAALDDASLEARMRLARLLAPLDERAKEGAGARMLRAIEVLERIGTKEARAVLRRLAEGAPGAALTEEARGALGRLISPLSPP